MGVLLGNGACVDALNAYNIVTPSQCAVLSCRTDPIIRFGNKPTKLGNGTILFEVVCGCMKRVCRVCRMVTERGSLSMGCGQGMTTNT